MSKNKKGEVAFLLTGGGARAAYQLGVLKYLFKELKCIPESPILLGTSAGAINTFYLGFKAHKGFDKAIDDLCNMWSDLTVGDIYKTDAWSILKGLGNFVFNFTLGRFVKKRHAESLLDTTPLYLMLRKRLQEDHFRMHENIEKGHIKALGLSTMQYGTGKNITFFESGKESGCKGWKKTKREGRKTKLRLKHVLASAAIPLLFPAVKLENAYFGDGSVRQNAPLSAGIALGAKKIFAINLGRFSTDNLKPLEYYPSISQIGGMLYNTIFLDTLDYDIRMLNRVNSLLGEKGRMEEGGEPLKKVEAFVIRPSRDLGLLALPFRKNIPKTLSFLVGGLGPKDRSSADFLSYILFSGDYLKVLIQEGFNDAKAKKDEILKFFASVEGEK